MSVFRLVVNLIVAALVLTLVVLVLFTGYGVVVSRRWEHNGLADGVAEGNWVWIDEHPFYVKTWGPDDGSPVVLVHDLDVVGLQAWRPNAAILGKWGLRVIAVDLKGFGHSVRDRSSTYSIRDQAILLAKVLNPMQVRNATVVGHGRGSAVALQLVLEQPQFVGRLVLVSPSLGADDAQLWRRAANIPGLGRALTWLMASGGPIWRANQRGRMIDSSALSAQDWQIWLRPTHVVGTVDALLAMARSDEDSDLPGALSTVEVPTLILWGEQDQEISLEAIQRLVDELPDAKLATIPNAGYHLQMDAGRDVNRRIADFVLGDTR